MAIPASIDEVRVAVAEALHWPHNLGIQLQTIPLGRAREGEALLLYIQGLADEELIRLRILQPLARLAPPFPAGGRLTPADLAAALSTPRIRRVGELAAVIEGVLKGTAALFLDGASQAVLVEVEASAARPAGGVVSEQPYMDTFGGGLIDNIALVRRRLSDPALIAEPHTLPHQRGNAALLYLKGRADPEVVAQVREWVERRGGEEALRRGLAAGLKGKLGLLPDRLSTKWPDQAASLLDAGYVAVMIDQLHHAFIAPVTASAMLAGAFDAEQIRPIGHWLRLIRFTLCLLVLTGSASIVAVMNYHQEMVPAPFLMALTSVREHAPLPILAAVLLLEAFQEIMREAGFHLPGRVGAGAALIAGKILILILVQGGVVGALEGAVSVGVAFTIIGFVNYELVYMLRPMRFAMILAAGILGFFGMATVLFLFSIYFVQARSYGVPFFGEPGVRFTASGGISSRRQGGKRDAS
ncbi:MAG: spore germination protein [Bacillota bacterium]